MRRFLFLSCFLLALSVPAVRAQLLPVPETEEQKEAKREWFDITEVAGSCYIYYWNEDDPYAADDYSSNKQEAIGDYINTTIYHPYYSFTFDEMNTEKFKGEVFTGISFDITADRDVVLTDIIYYKAEELKRETLSLKAGEKKTVTLDFDKPFTIGKKTDRFDDGNDNELIGISGLEIFRALHPDGLYESPVPAWKEWAKTKYNISAVSLRRKIADK